MDVKDPSASVRHPLSGIAPDGAGAAPDTRAQQRDGDHGSGRPKDIIGPTDFTEERRPPPDFVDFREADYKDVVDFTDIKDVTDIRDFVDVKDIIEQPEQR